MRPAPPQDRGRGDAFGGRPLKPRHVVLLLAGSAVFLFPFLGAGSLERAEVYFLDGARSMVETGDWLVPRYQGQPFFDKPPLTCWLIAASFRVFGFGTAAARLVPALAALGVILATVWVGTLFFDRRVALAGGWILATTFGFMIFSRVAMSDMLLALWSTLAFGLTLALFEGPAAPFTLPALGAVLGLGFLTKGPVAVLLPGLGVLLLAWMRPRPAMPRRDVILAVSLFVLLGLGWYAVIWLRLGPAPLKHFFLRENLERFTGETYDAGRSPFFYLGTYLSEGAPWALFLPAALLAIVRTPAAGEAHGNAGARLLLGWIGLMLVPLSLSRGKIDYYILPLYPAASLVVAHYIVGRSWGAFDRGWARGVLFVGAAALAFVPRVAYAFPAPWLPGPARFVVAGVAIVAASALLVATDRASPGRVLVTLAAASATVFLAAVAFAVPAFVSAQPNAAIVAAVVRERAYRPDVEVALCSDPARVQRDLLFHARIAVRELCDLWSPASSDRPFLLVLQRNERDSLRELREFRMVSGHDFLPAAMINVEKLLSPPEPEPLFLAANYPSRDPEVLEAQRRRLERLERRERRKEGVAAGASPEGLSAASATPGPPPRP
jgi:4-amino-4-deoxy-L-arabinose transferase-like glycosyltransferase